MVKVRGIKSMTGPHQYRKTRGRVCEKERVRAVCGAPLCVEYYISDKLDCVFENNLSVQVKQSIMKEWN